MIIRLIAGIGGAVAAIVDVQIGFPILPLLIGLIAIVFGFGLLIMLIVASIKGFKGQIYKIPLIGGFADKWS